MAAVSSALLTVTWGGTAVTGIGSCSVNTSQTMIDASEIGTAAQIFITGNRTTTASIDMFYSQADAGMAAIETAANTGAASATLVILLSTGMQYSGAALVTSFQVTGSTNEVLRASIEFQFTGTITIT